MPAAPRESPLARPAKGDPEGQDTDRVIASAWLHDAGRERCRDRFGNIGCLGQRRALVWEQDRRGGPLAGSQSRPHPSLIIDNARTDTSPICCMVAGQCGRWARNRHSRKAGAASPACRSKCSKRCRSSRSAKSAPASMRSTAPARVTTGLDGRACRRGAATTTSRRLVPGDSPPCFHMARSPPWHGRRPRARYSAVGCGNIFAPSRGTNGAPGVRRGMAGWVVAGDAALGEQHIHTQCLGCPLAGPSQSRVAQRY